MDKFKKQLIIDLIALMVFSWVVTDSYAQSNAFNDDKIKSVFIYNLTHFASWPETSNSQSMGPFSICLLGEKQFDNILEKVVENESVNGAPIVVKRTNEIDTMDITQCRILFVAEAFRNEFSKVISQTQGKPVLVIGDTPGFAEEGGMINLIREEDRINIEINIQQVTAAGLKLNAKLLQLARIVK